MPTEWLRVAAFCTYLAAWVILAVVAVVRAIPRRKRHGATSGGMTVRAMVGMLMQGVAALPITLTLSDAPIRPGTVELIGTIALALIAVGVLCWTVWSVPGDASPQTLATQGAYSWLRHPMYLAFLAMLLATGLVVSAGIALVAATVVYVAGTELRVASEEAELVEKFPTEYETYRLRTRWRYLPGLR